MKRKAWEDIYSDTMYLIYIKSEMHLVKLRGGLFYLGLVASLVISAPPVYVVIKNVKATLSLLAS